MSFRVGLSQDVVAVEPGQSLPLAVNVRHDGADEEPFELVMEGLDPEWVAVPVPTFSLKPGETRGERIFLKPPRVSESAAGTYPFVVSVRSLASGETATVQGVLDVRPFNSLSAEINPKKGLYAPLSQQNSFDVTLLNLGNTPHHVQLTGTDVDDWCAYEFEEEHLLLNPGQQREVEVTVKPRRQSLVASGRLIGFTVTARSTDAPNVSAVTQGQLEQRALLSPISLAALLLLALVAGFWWANRPQPPSVSLMLDPPRVVRGGTVKVKWEADPRSRVKITDEAGNVLYEGAAAQGSMDYKVTQRATVTFRAVATRSGMESGPETASLTVEEPERVDPPRITEFSASDTRVRLGETIFLRYKLSNSVVSATLAPLNVELDQSLNQIQVTPSAVGTIEYQISAKNKSGQAAVRSLKVNVYQASRANVLAFSADKREVLPNDLVTLSWQVTNAARVELKSASGTPEVVEAEGSRTLSVATKTTFILTAYDEQGLRVSDQVTIRVSAPRPTIEPYTPDTGGEFPETVPPITTTGGPR